MQTLALPFHAQESTAYKRAVEYHAECFKRRVLDSPDWELEGV
jgi:hypothetical protein